MTDDTADPTPPRRAQDRGGPAAPSDPSGPAGPSGPSGPLSVRAAKVPTASAVGASAPAPPGADPTPPRRTRTTTGPVQYKGDDLEPARGPGLGCFRFQLAVLVVFIVLTPLTVVWNWPATVSTVLLFVVIGLLLTTGQTIIFLLRLVAADRRGRRVPLAGGSRTVGELEDAERSAPSAALETAEVAQVSLPGSSEGDSEPTAAPDRSLGPDA